MIKVYKNNNDQQFSLPTELELLGTAIILQRSTKTIIVDLGQQNPDITNFNNDFPDMMINTFQPG